MAERSVVHDTVVVCRTYEASAERVYRAWSDRAELERWYVPGDEKWTAKMSNHDFRVGGGKRFVFGPPDQTFVEDCHYVDIVPEHRICYAMTISRGDTRITVSMVTVELAPHGRRCDVRVTDQLAILDDGDTARDRERGWGETLDKLSAVVGQR
jgi:uncharacterized protein YndB with AHSA1/START domain